jgi:hypothetical protein
MDLDLGRLVREATREELPRIVGQLVEAEILARLRLTEVSTGPTTSSRSLDPDAAAEIAATTKRWLLAHTKDQKFRTDHSKKVVRFDEGGLRAWVVGRSR